RLARNDVVINLQRQGGHFLLPVTLDGRTEASLLIDTGATMTVLRPQVLARAGYGPAQAQTTRRFSTANGLTDGQIFQLDEFSLGGVRLPGLSVVGLELGELQADGLLGMDVLGQFQFQIEQEQNQLRLRKK
ncbi:MAG: retroviral-like aspartic protease family protein, partial [Gammaproteobacteria bacterium]|nr:retroviral-like aspartic protease family protein [Gammaproteobacteria bacterium]